MLYQDERAVAVSTGRRDSLDAYERALWEFSHYRGDPVATIDAALALDPDFVSGHVLRAMLAISMWERSVLPAVCASLDRLAVLAARTNDRERSLAAAIRRWVDGDWEGMRLALDRHLVDYPTDGLALQVGHLSDFLHGDRENLRGRIGRALPFWDAGMPGYGCVLGMYAFGLEECGNEARAEEIGRAALACDANDAWAHHAVAHVMEMQGRGADGIAWMRDRESHWAQPDNAFAFHNWWHWALFHLDRGEATAALQLYDRGIRPRPSQVQLEMIDAAAMLWRMQLQRIDVGDRFAELAQAYEATAAEAGFYAFNDLHAMMALVGSGRMVAAGRLMEAVERSAEQGGTNAAMARAVGLQVVRAFHAFGRGRCGETVELLLPVRFRANAFGGSHAQRDVIHRTLLEAAKRDGQDRLALTLATERLALKPDCPFARREHRRARQAAGSSAGPAAAVH